MFTDLQLLCRTTMRNSCQIGVYILLLITTNSSNHVTNFGSWPQTTWHSWKYTNGRQYHTTKTWPATKLRAPATGLSGRSRITRLRFMTIPPANRTLTVSPPIHNSSANLWYMVICTLAAQPVCNVSSLLIFDELGRLLLQWTLVHHTGVLIHTSLTITMGHHTKTVTGNTHRMTLDSVLIVARTTTAVILASMVNRSIVLDVILLDIKPNFVDQEESTGKGGSPPQEDNQMTQTCLSKKTIFLSLQWRHNECYGVLNHRRLDCLLNHLFRRRKKKTSKFRVTGLSEGNPPVTRGFPSERASDAETISIRWRHHMMLQGDNVMRGFEAWSWRICVEKSYVQWCFPDCH